MSHISQVVGLLGARYTGKTTLAQGLRDVLFARGWDVVLVPDETLCLDVPGGAHMSCARPQSFVHRQEVIAVARQKHRLVLVDNPPMPGGPPARRASGDTGGNANEIDIVLAPETDLNLLLSTDLLWTNADLAEVRRQEARDAEIRSVMHSRAIGFEVVAGSGPSRLNHALAAVEHLLDASARQLRIKDRPRWRWVCARCDDGECEQHWLARRG